MIYSRLSGNTLLLILIGLTIDPQRLGPPFDQYIDSTLANIQTSPLHGYMSQQSLALEASSLERAWRGDEHSY